MQEKNQRQARKDSKAGKKRLIGRPEKTHWNARKHSKAGKKTLQCRQENTPMQARKDPKGGRQKNNRRRVKVVVIGFER
jgi:hypothetical protein